MNDAEFEHWVDLYYSTGPPTEADEPSNSKHHDKFSPARCSRHPARHSRQSGFSFSPRWSSATYLEPQYPPNVHPASMSTFGKGHDFEVEIRSVSSQYSALELKDLPNKRQSRIVRNIRHTFFTVYRRLFSIVFLANLIASILITAKYGILNVPFPITTTAASGNFFAAVLIRQDFFNCILYRTSWLVPRSAPLRLRRLVAEVHENGGVHSGAAVAGTLWFILLNTTITSNFLQGSMHSTPLFYATWVLQSTLLLILLFAHPAVRARFHNSFEYMHRFGGWLAIGLFWVESLLISEVTHKMLGVSMVQVAVTQPALWLLSITTVLLILPWLRLRKWDFIPERLSSHATRLHYTRSLPPFSCLKISDSPFLEWHPFATFPAPNGEPGGSMVISDAGDWTHRLNVHPSTQYWVKGVPTVGTLSMACIFQRIILVTTGSGIGPSLGYLLDRPEGQSCRLIWSTRTPVETYGAVLNDWIDQVAPDALILDTNKTSRPDLIYLAYQNYVNCNAEAVFVLSNHSVTRKIVYAMETRGIPAYGPIWDS